MMGFYINGVKFYGSILLLLLLLLLLLHKSSENVMTRANLIVITA